MVEVVSVFEVLVAVEDKVLVLVKVVAVEVVMETEVEVSVLDVKVVV